MKNWKIGTRFFLVALLAASLGLSGCSGDDGSAGVAGTPGTPGVDGAAGTPGTPGSAVVDVSLQPADAIAALSPTAAITGVTIASPPVVSFTVTDSTGRGIAGLKAIRDGGVSRLMRFNIAKLVPGANGSPDSWVNYIRSSSGTPSTENTGTLVDNGDGSYVYTFANDITAIAAVPYEPTLTHRVAGQIGDGALALPAMNFVFDFVPAGGAVVLERKIAHSGSCNECHSNLTIHGRRFAIEYCVTCHNPDLTGGAGDMANMTHKIHMGAYLANGFDLGGHDYSDLVFTMNSFSTPEGLRNCRKCHTGEDAQTPQGSNWRTKPSRVACGSCHDDVNFETGFLHGNRLTSVRTTTGLRQSVVDPAKTAIIQTSDASCTSCHVDGGALGPEAVHRTWVSSDHNPEVPAWAKILQYEIASFTLADTAVANQKQATVKFRMLAKQNSTDAFATVNLNSLATVGATAQNLSFRLIWATPQAAPASPFDGPAVATPADWNNASGGARTYFNGAVSTATSAFDQPVSVNLSAVVGGMAAMPVDADGFYAAVLNYNLTPQAFAAVTAATMRSIGMEGGLTVQRRDLSNIPVVTTAAANVNVLLLGRSLIVGETTNPAAPIAALGGVSTNVARRSIVDIDRCNQCHEWFGFHGSQARNDNPDYCVACHNTEMTNSGRGTDPIDPTISYGEFSNNLKDMIHAIHGAEKRTIGFDFVRGSIAGGGGGAGIHSFSGVDFFGRGNECSACHKPGTYLPEAVPGTALWTTLVAAPTATVATFNPAANLRMGPISAACYSCHDSAASAVHMAANIASTRAGVTESCVTCHGAGRSADVDVVHGN